MRKKYWVSVAMFVTTMVVLAMSVNLALARWSLRANYESYVERTCTNGMIVGFTYDWNPNEKVYVVGKKDNPLDTETLPPTQGPAPTDLPDGFTDQASQLARFWIIRWTETLELGESVVVEGDKDSMGYSYGTVDTCDINERPLAPSQYRQGNNGNSFPFCGENATSTSNHFEFPADLMIYDLDVSMHVTGMDNPTSAVLESPSGERVTLFSNLISSDGNLGLRCDANSYGTGQVPQLVFDDEAPENIMDYEPPEEYEEIYANYFTTEEEEGLEDFDGISSKGTWTLTVSNNANTADLECWCLDIIGREQVDLVLNVNGKGNTIKSPDKESYLIGENVTIRAIPDSGYKFQGWSGDADGSQNPLELTMNEDLIITANFIIDPNNSPGNTIFIPAAMAASAGSNPPPPNATPTYTATPSPTATATATATATPTATYTPTPTATATTEPFNGAIPNGGFESGPSYWYEDSAQGTDLITHESYLPVDARSGSWAVWLGGLYDEYSYVEQTLHLHNAAKRLTFYGWAASQETGCGYDYAFVELDNGSSYDFFTLDLCDDTDTSGWVSYWVPVDAFAGTTVTVRIGASTDFSNNSNFFLDDVAFSDATLNEISQFRPTSKQAPAIYKSGLDAAVLSTKVEEQPKR